MTDAMHPEVAAVLAQARRLQSLMDDQLAKMRADTFRAAGATETVEITLNGHHHLVDVVIADGLLRLGAGTVQDRLNEALTNATADAASTLEADQDWIDDQIAAITGDGDRRD